MPESALAAVALGANLPSRFGAPAETLREALRRMAALGEVMAVSSFHTTAPVGYVEQPEFVNAAALVTTELRPRELLRGLLEIEQAMGRERAGAPPKGPRVIDLDLLLYRGGKTGSDETGSGNAGRDAVLHGAELTLPHPAMHERRFVLAPLAEIAAEWRHPVLGRTVGELLRALG